MRASEIGLPTYEPEVSCNAFCYGGGVCMTETTAPQYTEAADCWVRGDVAGAKIAALRERLSEASRLLRIQREALRSFGVEKPTDVDAFLGVAVNEERSQGNG